MLGTGGTGEFPRSVQRQIGQLSRRISRDSQPKAANRSAACWSSTALCGRGTRSLAGTGTILWYHPRPGSKDGFTGVASGTGWIPRQPQRLAFPSISTTNPPFPQLLHNNPAAVYFIQPQFP